MVGCFHQPREGSYHTNDPIVANFSKKNLIPLKFVNFMTRQARKRVNLTQNYEIGK